MSNVQLTEMQQAAADFPHTKPAVVTAAAGSGKTTLLVERVTRLLSDPALGIKADSPAIMTFTRNATNSLREKLNTALNKRLEELSEKSAASAEREWLSGQIFALRQASISTIDAFCQKIIRENPESFDLPINFTIASAPKKAAMQDAAIRAAMQDFYNDNAEDPFPKQQRETLFYTFDFENDEKLRKAVIETAETLSSYVDAEKWLSETENAYESLEALSARYLPIYAHPIERYIRLMNSCCTAYDSIIGELGQLTAADVDSEKAANPEKTLKTVTETVIPSLEEYSQRDRERLKSVTEKYHGFTQAPSLGTLRELITECENAVNTVKEKSLSGKGCGDALRKSFRTVKKSFEEALGGIAELAVSEEFEKSAFEEQKTAITAFIKLLRIYRGYYNEIKKSSGSIDFSDCELMLLEKLNNEDFRHQISERFSCVIVDEFQDSNDIQAAIFRKIGEGRLFYVGDVKQAIYAFRGGNPEIMARLCSGAEGFASLPLNQNFRSRREVIDTVNLAFSGLMTPEFGGVEYADNVNRLVMGRDFPESDSDYKSEIHLINDENARYVARRIKELHDDPGFHITKGGEKVRPSYSDFIILTRNGGKFEEYRKALKELGIGSNVQKGKNLLEAEEIEIVLSFLRVVDNPMRSDELLKLMMSPIFRFTAEEMGKIRLGILGLPEDFPENKLEKITSAMKKYSLFRCVQLCGEPLETGNYVEGESAVIEREKSEKLIRFLEVIRRFRDLKSASSVYNLIRKIYEETDLTFIVSAFEDSAVRVANIRQLLEIAFDFEERDGGNLSDFLRFLERASDSLSSSFVNASGSEEQADSVGIMTFHGSKGLEAPVCVLAELQTQMSDDDYTGTLLVNRDSYMALKHVDIKRRVKRNTMTYNAISEEIRKKQCGEELRLLYVAMTRAQEKLIMVGKIGQSDIYPDPNIKPFTEGYFSGTIPFKWVLKQLLVYYDMDCGRVPFTLITDAQTPEPPERSIAETRNFDIPESEVENLSAIINRKYAFDEDTRQQSKLTVTQLAHMSDASPVILTTPSFVNRAPTGAERGNAYHHCMELFPLEKIRGANPGDYAKIVEFALDEMSQNRLITEREREIVKAENIVRFFSGELGQRMLKSSLVRREEPFYAEIGGELLGLDYEGAVSVQGRIDMYFVENGELVIVDYKTDSAANLEKEKENYAQQVAIYAHALPKLKGMAVRAIYLYAFTNGKAIEIQ